MTPTARSATQVSLDGSAFWRRGFVRVGASSVVIALLGWLVFVVVARELGPSGYARFSVLWGFVFALGGILSGLQQETTRSVTTGSTQAPNEQGDSHSAISAALVLALSSALLVAVTSPAWAPPVMGEVSLAGVAAVCSGIASLGVFLVMRGVLAARGEWLPFSVLGTADAAVRCLVVSAVCVWASSSAATLWAIVSGWLTWILLVPVGSASSALSARQSLALGASLCRSLSAMVATGCTALLVAGFPFLARVTSGDGLGPSAGVLFAAVLATRTPLTLPLNGYQLMILRHLVGRRGSLRQALLPLLAGAAVVTLVGMGLAALVGPTVLRAFFGSGFDASAILLVALVGAAGLLAAMTLTGFAALAADRHAVYTIGWVVATAVTIGLLLLPMSLTDRSLLALLLGPVGGAAVHSVALRRPRQGSADLGFDA